MRGGRNKTGYTITEVLIVLAISSAMFLVANSFLSGRVAETSFRTGVNEMASRLEDLINQVSSGQYSDLPKGTCTISPADGKPYLGIGSIAQGSNNPCIFIGKTITFGNNSKVYSIELVAGNKNSNTLDDSGARSIGSIFDYNLPNGLVYVAKSGIPNKFAFIQNPEGSSLSGSRGAKNIIITDDNFSDSAAGIQGGVSVCLSDNKRSGKLTIGENNNVLSIKKDFYYGSADCT